MPRPPKRSLNSAPPQEEAAKGPRSLSPPRFFREKQTVAKASHGVPAAPERREEAMTATARLRLDEASRLFPEAHRPHERRPKQDSMQSFGKQNRGSSPDRACRLVPQSQASRPMPQPRQPQAMQVDVPRCQAMSSTIQPQVARLQSYDRQRSRSASPFRLRTGSDALFDRPTPVASYSFGAPAVYQKPFVMQQGVQSMNKLSTVQLGGLQQAWRSTPWSPQPAPRVVVTRRSVSPVRTGHVRVYPASPSPQYPASPAVSPQAMYRTILPEANPFAYSRPNGSPLRRDLPSPVLDYRFVDPSALGPRIYRPCRLSQKGNVEANDCKKGLTVSDARSPQEGSENGDRKSCADTKYSDGENAGDLSSRNPASVLTQTNEDLEEAYILSAFRQPNEGWKEAVAEASTAAKAVLDHFEAPKRRELEEKSLPSVESLRATLQALRAQDRWEREAETVPNTASDVREFDARFNEAQELHA